MLEASPMKMREIIARDAIVARLQSPNRDDAIGEMLDSLIAANVVEGALKKQLMTSVIEREKRGSTGFGKGVAVPHVKLPGLKKMVAAVGVSQTGVDFNALDKQPVFSIILLISPAERPEEHLQAMEVIFKNLSQDAFRRFLRQANSADDVWTLMGEADAQHLPA